MPGTHNFKKTMGYKYGGKIKKMRDGGPGSEEYKRTMNLIESGSATKSMKKADRTGEAEKSAKLVKATSGAGASDPYYKSTRKADEVINTKRDLGGGARMTLSDKVTKKPMSDADKERGLGTTKTKKLDPQTTAKNKARMNSPTFEASQEGRGRSNQLAREVNVRGGMRKILGHDKKNPRENREGWESESKYRKMKGMKNGGRGGGKSKCRGSGKATQGTGYTIR